MTLIVNGVSPYISHITKYTGLRQFEKCYNVISQCFYSTAQTLTSDISISTKIDMYHYKIDTTIYKELEYIAGLLSVLRFHNSMRQIKGVKQSC